MDKKKNTEAWDWLDQALNEPGKTTTTPLATFLCHPNAETPQFLLPIDSSKAASTALRRYNDGQKYKKKLSTAAASTAARLHLFSKKILLKKKKNIITIPQWDLVQHLSVQLGEPALLAAVTLGPPRRNRKPVLQLIRATDGKTIGFAKIGWSPLTKKLLHEETTILKKVENKLPHWLQAPTVLHEETWGQIAVTVFAPVDISIRSQRSGLIEREKMLAFAKTTEQTMPTLAQNPWMRRWATSDEHKKYVDFKKLKAKHRGKKLACGLFHGDFTPWNTATDSEVTSLWDWEFAAEHKPIGLDTLHSHFELHRRNPATSTDEALLQTEKQLDATTAGLSEHPETLFDFYLCELLNRELLLSNQKWGSENLEPLLPTLQKFLHNRGISPE